MKNKRSYESIPSSNINPTNVNNTISISNIPKVENNFFVSDSSLNNTSFNYKKLMQSKSLDKTNITLQNMMPLTDLKRQIMLETNYEVNDFEMGNMFEN